MLQDFNSNKMLEDLRESTRINQEHEKILQRLEETIELLSAKQKQKATLEREKANALVTTEKASIFSRIASVFHRGKYYETMQLIKAKEEELERITAECIQLAEQEEKLSACKVTMGKEKGKIKTPECIKEEQGRLVITSGKTGLGSYSLSQDSEQVDPSKKVLIHCTNFFPRDNKILSDYDGEKIGTTEIEYNGVKKETSALIHRHEVHFTINNRVENTGAGEGKWDNPSYIIIEGYDAHQDELESDSPSDAWTKGTSVTLSDSAVIMVRLQDKDKLPIQPEEMDKYNIVFYDGNPTTCLRNFLRLNNYDIFHTDPNSPGHAHSTRMMQERGLQARNLAINFVKDNTHFSKEPPVFSQEEMAQIVDVGYTMAPGVISPAQLMACIGDQDIPKDKQSKYLQVANFVVGSGMKITEDGSYTFDSDDEIFSNIEALHEDRATLPSNIDISLINKVFKMQQEVEEKHATTPLPSLQEFLSMPIQDLYRFENQLACEALQRTLPKRSEMAYRKEGVRIELYENDVEGQQIGERVQDEDGVSYTDMGTWGIFEKNIAITTRASAVGKIFADFKAKTQEIKGRELQTSDGER